MTFRLPSWYRAAGSATAAILAGFRSPRTGPWPRAEEPTVWIHAASLGESKGLETILRALPATVQTTTTCTTAAAVRRLRERGIPAVLLPCDHSPTVLSFLEARRVRKALFLEAEAWPAALEALASRRVPAAFAAFRSGPRSLLRWRRFSGAFPGWTENVDVVWTDRPESRMDVRGLGFRDVRPGTSLKWSEPPPPPGPRGGADAAVSLHLRDLPALRKLVRSRQARGWLWFPRHPARAALFGLFARALGLSPVERMPGPGEVRISRRLGEVAHWLPGCEMAWVSPGHDIEEPFRYGVPEVATGNPPFAVLPERPNCAPLLDQIAEWLR